MTREEAITILSSDEWQGNEDLTTAYHVAMEALQQETVSKETYDHEFNLRKEFEMKVFVLERKMAEQEPKRGKWIAIDDTHSQCMECGAIFCITSSNEWEVNYCPNCGARVEFEEAEQGIEYKASSDRLTTDEDTEILTTKQRGILAQARKVYGGKNQVTVAAEECCELAKELLKAIRYEDFNAAVAKTKPDVTEEVADVLIVLDHIINLYNITDTDLTPHIDRKLERLSKWLEHSKSMEYTTELRDV